MIHGQTGDRASEPPRARVLTNIAAANHTKPTHEPAKRAAINVEPGSSIRARGPRVSEIPKLTNDDERNSSNLQIPSHVT